MSYYSDHDKYGDFFNSYSPNKQQRPSNGGRQSPKKPKRRLKAWVKAAIAVIVLGILVLVTVLSVFKFKGSDSPEGKASDITPSDSASVVNTLPGRSVARPVSADYTVTLGNNIESKNAILMDTSNGTILARRNADERIYPASMTKVMTLLAVAEHIDDINATFKMTSAIIDPLYKSDLVLAGFGPGEEVKIIDMIYGMVLKSGAEASVGLAVYISGSEEEFVKLMNQKASSLGLTDTNFVNVSGKHDKNHYTTCTEMAMIMHAAIENDFCRQVLSTEYYTVAANSHHEELKFHSGMFEKMYGTEPDVATIKGGKTGFTSQSLFCLVSFAETDDKRDIICVTAQGEGKYSPVYDCIKLYKTYTHPRKAE